MYLSCVCVYIYMMKKSKFVSIRTRSVLMSYSKRTYSNQNLNKIYRSDTATIQRPVYKSHWKGYKLWHFDSCWKYVRKKPEGVKVEDAMLLDAGFLHQTALTIQSHLWEKTGNYNGEIFILIKLIPLFTKNSSLQHLLMLCQERCRCPPWHGF